MKTIVDDESYELVKGVPWYAMKSKSNYYAVSTSSKNVEMHGKRSVLMHRLILGIVNDKLLGDHINGNTLDNRSSNLRSATMIQSNRNIGVKKASQSKYKGVWRKCEKSAWYARIYANGNKCHVRCDSEIEAAIKYNELALRYHGEFARLNNIAPFESTPEPTNPLESIEVIEDDFWDEADRQYDRHEDK